jgi:hypothetical protein
MFSDVISAYREGNKFFWSTSNDQMDLKTRNLSIESGLAPDFGPIFASWRKRAAAASQPQPQ